MKIEKKTVVLETRPFKVEELELSYNGEPINHPYYRLDSPDWVNILAITLDQKAVLIRQARVGVAKTVLEVPGGMIDPGEKDATMAAVRELEEETGYTSQRILSLGSINANPAIMNNRCHFFLALASYLNPNRQHFPDAEERIEVVTVNPKELDSLVRTSQIDHSLAALCVLLASRYIDIGATSPRGG